MLGGCDVLDAYCFIAAVVCSQLACVRVGAAVSLTLLSTDLLLSALCTPLVAGVMACWRAFYAR